MPYKVLMLNPSEVIDCYWLGCRNNDIYKPSDGKWMLFYKNEIIDEKWKLLTNLYFSNKLEGVVSLKVSTAKPNPRSSNPNESVIILFCSGSNNKDYIINIGHKILEKIGNYEKEYLYYKSNYQTELGTESTGNKNNFLYKIKNIF